MNDQNSVEGEGKFEKWDRGRSLFLESLHKADHELRGCAHNQKCYHELMEMREFVIEAVKQMKNPYINPEKAGDKNRATVDATDGISNILYTGALGDFYRNLVVEEKKKEKSNG